MSDELLDPALATAGGQELWDTLCGLKVDISIGGPIWTMKGRPPENTRHRSFDGLLVATRRRVFRRNPDNSVDLDLPSITLDIHDVELAHSDDEQAQP
ncbi:hypothetical protein [Kitasatospora sp. NPDC093102]|uniref:hypothetical protein n=1 Tax=Kitasatospora sp. NPDC093102 TaxID=3155069 RepID=UPI003449F94D